MNSRSNAEFLTGLLAPIVAANISIDAAVTVDGNKAQYPVFGKGG